MSSGTAQPVSISVDETHRVSGLLQVPPQARACYVLAHGAGAGITHPFMEAVAAELGTRGVATLRYQFPYMQQGGRRPDQPSLAHATVRGAVAEAARLIPELPLFAGGKSFGGRMTSQAQAAAPLPGIRGLIFLGFPLHPAGRPAEIAAVTCSRSGCRCCSCRENATSSPTSSCLGGSSSGLARAPPCGSSRMPITPFTCRPGRDGRTRRSEANWVDALVSWIDFVKVRDPVQRPSRVGIQPGNLYEPPRQRP